MNRRAFITRAAGFLAAPAIVRVGSIMPISPLRAEVSSAEFVEHAARFLIEASTDGVNWTTHYDAQAIQRFFGPQRVFVRRIPHVWVSPKFTAPEPPPAIPEGS